MSYQVLARKWRPRSFEEMVGQTHVLRALTNALDSGRLHHAYLFTGTRGVGKTTLARILARCLNCEAGVGSRPCGQCRACRAIDDGVFLDLIEVDAASRTKVEDTRELLDNVQYAPTQGRYKVYLIDEVHMLSGHSFNALLKTLEEPPPHVKFLLATTDPQKVPVTVLSRCLQFNLKRLSPESIAAQLRHILEQEGVAAEARALAELARAADGSLRDALSLLDQAIAYGAGNVVEADVRNMLGTVERERIFDLLEALADANGALLLQHSAALAEQAVDLTGVLGEMISALQRIALAQVVPEAVEDQDPQAERIRALAARMPPEDVQLFYQIGLTGRRDLAHVPDLRGGFDMVLLRMLAFQPAAAPAADPRGHPAHAGGPQPRAEPRPPAQHRTEPQATPRVTGTPNRGHALAAEARDPETSWGAIVAQLKLGGLALQLAKHCVLERSDGDRICLNLSPAHASVLNERQQARLQEALSEHLGRATRLQIRVQELVEETPAGAEQRQQKARQQAAESSIETDPHVQALLETFDGTIVAGSIQPLEE